MVGVLSDVFHDIDLTALWPSDSADVGAEHPESGPHALSSGEFGSHFEFTVGGVVVSS